MGLSAAIIWKRGEGRDEEEEMIHEWLVDGHGMPQGYGCVVIGIVQYWNSTGGNGENDWAERRQLKR